MNRKLFSASLAALVGVALIGAACFANQPGTESKSPADAAVQKNGPVQGPAQKVAPVQKDVPTQKVAPVQNSKMTPVQGPTQKVSDVPTQKSPVQKVGCDDCGGGGRRHHRRRGGCGC